MSRPAIHIGPSDNHGLAAAVRDGGGEVAPLERADAVVWFGEADELPELPASVRWVQLPAAGVESWLERIRGAPERCRFGRTGTPMLRSSTASRAPERPCSGAGVR